MNLFHYSPVANAEIFGRPIYNHILHKEDCLAEPARIMKLTMKTLKVEDLEVNHLASIFFYFSRVHAVLYHTGDRGVFQFHYHKKWYDTCNMDMY